MGRLAVYKFAYLLSIIFTLLILGLSVFAYFAGRIDPESNMFAAYIAFGKPILVIINILLFFLLACQIQVLGMDSATWFIDKLRIYYFHVSSLQFDQICQ